MQVLDNITPLEKDFTRWYQDVVVKGNLIKYGSTQGSMMFKPIAYGIWENIQQNIDCEFKKLNVQNVYLPLLIKKSYITKEKEHIKGFAPELATVTKVGDRSLEEELVIRPTSETLFGELFASEIRSYKDLPLLYNQWVNVLRWEKKTNPFLRNREFLWQEGHTAHNNALEARQLARKMIKLYAKFLKNYLAMPVIIGKKTAHEKFAGATTTYTVEAMMKDGKALQSGTSHYLGQNFAKAFGVEFKNPMNQNEHVYQTSWGISTRLIGGLIMTHGDNRGVIIPPKVAPFQIDIIALFAHKNPQVTYVVNFLNKKLSRSFRVRVDWSGKSPGQKAAQSEIEGTPLRIEVGPRDVIKNLVTLIRRDNNAKINIAPEEVKSSAKQLLKDIQDNLYQNALLRLNSNFITVFSYAEFKTQILAHKFVIAPFAGNAKMEQKISEELGATARCIPFEHPRQEAKCIITNKPTKRYVVFAKAY